MLAGTMQSCNYLIISLREFCVEQLCIVVICDAN